MRATGWGLRTGMARPAAGRPAAPESAWTSDDERPGGSTRFSAAQRPGTNSETIVNTKR